MIERFMGHTAITCLVLLAYTLCVVPLTLSASSTGPADLVSACYNRNYNSTPTRFEDFLKGRPSSLFLHKSWWSKKQSTLPVTVFAGATLSRLDALEAQCRSYKGHHASAVYLPLLQQQSGKQLTAQNEKKLRDAVASIDELFSRLEGDPDACAPAIQLVYEVVAEEAMLFILPINLLRNIAILPARTPLVAMIDIDLLVSKDFSNIVAQPESLAPISRVCERGNVMILPAFETPKQLSMEEGIAVAHAAAAGDKDQLMRLVDNGTLHYFAEHVYKRGHFTTNFPRWYEATSPYQVPYEVNYEPWFVMSRARSPPYDVRFRGYGWNKVQQVAYVNATGSRFIVHPAAFVVHRPHPKSDAQAFYSTAYTGAGGGLDSDGRPFTLSKLFHRKVSAMRHVTIRDMRRGLYTPIVDKQSAACRQELPWWRAAPQ